MNLVASYIDSHPQLQQCLVHLEANLQSAVEAVAVQAPDVPPIVIKQTFLEEIEERQRRGAPAKRERWHVVCAPGSPGHECAVKLGLIE